MMIYMMLVCVPVPDWGGGGGGKGGGFVTKSRRSFSDFTNHESLKTPDNIIGVSHSYEIGFSYF